MTLYLDDVHDIDGAPVETTTIATKWSAVGASAQMAPKKLGITAVSEIEQRARLDVVDQYLAQPFAARGIHRELRRVAAMPLRGREYQVHDYVVYAELYRMLGPAKIGHALDLLAIQVDRAIDVCCDPTTEALAFEAHDLCGSAGMLGFMDLGAVSRRLQTVLAADTPVRHEYDIAFNAFVVALGRGKRILSALRAAIATDFVYRVCLDRFDRKDMSRAGSASRHASDELGHLA